MRTSALAAIFALTAFLNLSLDAMPSKAAQSAQDFAFTAIEGEPLPMTAFAGKTVLLVNTASRCGFTPQYDGLQALWERYREQGLVVLGVPSNDFGGQEPGSEAQIKEFCEVNFAVNFPLTAKEKVVGPEAHPLYRWLAAELGSAGVPAWNFHKVLIGPDGQAIAGWPSKVTPEGPEITKAVEAALKQ